MSNHLFLEAIKYRMPQMTKSFKRIAQYVLEHRGEVINQNISEISEATSTSDATVIRFCRSLGCEGYQDFKIKLAQSASSDLDAYSSSLSEHSSSAAIIQKVFSTGTVALQETLQTLDWKKLDEAAEKLAAAKSITIICSGNSLTVGRDLQTKLLKIGLNCFLTPDIDLQLMRIAALGEGDLVFCISHTGSTRTVHDLAKRAKEKGASILLLCAQAKTPIGRLADLVITVCAKESFFSSESSSARLAELSVCDSIFTIIVSKDLATYRPRLEHARHETSTNKF